MKVILTAKPNFKNFSIEAGKNDDVKHFDHHNLPGVSSPCNRTINPVGEKNITIEVTHLDADCFVGILRLTGLFDIVEFVSAGIDFDMMGKIDCNGSSVADKYDPTLCYMVGVSQYLRDNKMPRVTEDSQDITSLVKNLTSVPVSDLVASGKAMQERIWTDYIACKKAFDREAGVVFISCNASHVIDPSLPYGDKFEGFNGYDRVVVYRNHYKTVSVYCSPSSDFSYADEKIAGIQFAGHPKACGSPRGVEITESQAMAVWEALIKE